MFSTIIKKRNNNKHEQPEIYHGQILDRKGEYFTFGYVVNGENKYLYDCCSNYWDVYDFSLT